MIPKTSELHEIFECEAKTVAFVYENRLFLPITICPKDGYLVKRINISNLNAGKKTLENIPFSQRNYLLSKEHFH